MRLILSRKGFDSQNGGMPSPILPDGTLLSLPIPSDDGNVTYHELVFHGKSYFDIIQELNPRIADKLKDRKCHVDPDLSFHYREDISDWKPAFGQHGISQLHLAKHTIGSGDLFLFYGWFRRTEYDESGKLRFIDSRMDDTPNRHIIYGYMEIEEVLTNQSAISSEYPWHPHALNNFSNNALYVPKNVFSLDGKKKGYGLFKNAPIRQLTMEKHIRSEWALPDCLRNANITFHETGAYGWTANHSYFRAARKGQEFIIKDHVTGDLEKWLLDVIR